MDYNIVIRSYKRSKVLREKTFKILKRSGLLHKTLVFCRNEEEKAVYEKEFEDAPEMRIVACDGCGATEKFNFISRYFPEGHCLFFMDDDNRDFFTFDGTKMWLNASNLDEHLVKSFDIVRTHNLGSFTCLFSDNALWFRRLNRNDFLLTFLQGCAFGIINSYEIFSLSSPLSDVELTARLWMKYGGIFISREFGFKNNWKEAVSGGDSEAAIRQQASRLETTRVEAQKLCDRFPDVAKQPKYNKTYNWYDVQWRGRSLVYKNLAKRGIAKRRLSNIVGSSESS